MPNDKLAKLKQDFEADNPTVRQLIYVTTLEAELAKTQKALDKACKYNATYLHECPHEDCPQPKTVDCSACWKAYFMSITPEQFGAEFGGAE